MSDFFFLNWYYMCFHPHFLVFFKYYPLREKNRNSVLFGFEVKITYFCVFNFLTVCHAAKKNKICCFLTSYTHQVEFFLLMFLIL